MKALLRKSPPRPTREVGSTCVALAVVAVAMAAILALDLPQAISGALLLLAVSTVALIVGRFGLARGDWFHPYVFPLGYVTLSLTAPAIYLGLAGRPLEALPNAVTLEMAALFIAVILGLAAGLSLSLARLGSGLVTGTDNGLDYRRMLKVGRVSLLAATALKLYAVSGQLGEAYGTNSVSFGATHSIDVIAGFLVLAGLALASVANVQLCGTVLSKVDAAVVSAFALTTLASGGRDELIAVMLFLAWAQHTLVRRIRLVPILAASLTLVVVLQGVVGVRAGESVVGGVAPFLDRTMTSIGTPTFDASETIRRVPKEREYELGATYSAAIKRQLPGPLAVKLFGEPDDTGAYVFRDLIGFDDPNAGFGFSLPSEAYLNFGIAGGAGVAVIVGVFLGYAFRRARSPAIRPVHLLYPIALASLPTALRSDALGQLKSVLYPMAALTAGFSVCGAYRRMSLKDLSTTRLRPYKSILHRPASATASTAPIAPHLLRRSRVILAVTLLLPPVAFAAGLRERRLFNGPALSAAVATATGIPLQPEGPNRTRAVDILSAYSGATSGESIVVIICGDERDASKLAKGRSLGRVKALQEGNAVVFYSRGSGTPDRTRQITQVLRRSA